MNDCNASYSNYVSCREKKLYSCMKISQAISRTTVPNIGLFVLIFMHFLCWCQNGHNISQMGHFFRLWRVNILLLWMVTSVISSIMVWSSIYGSSSFSHKVDGFSYNTVGSECEFHGLYHSGHQLYIPYICVLIWSELIRVCSDFRLSKMIWSDQMWNGWTFCKSHKSRSMS